MIGVAFTILVTLAVLSLLILIHEIGHYVAARASGVRVRELGLGFPPRLFAVRRAGIDYSVNAILFGGFVRLEGEDDPTVPGGFAGRPIRVRVLVIAAGSLMNLLLAWVIFTGLAALPYQRLEGDAVVTQVVPGSPAAQAGLRPNDIIAAVDGERVWHPIILQTWTTVQAGRPVTLRVVRDSVPLAVTLVPRQDPPAGEGRIGVEIDLINRQVVSYRTPLWETPIAGLRMGFAVVGLVGREVGRWVGGTAEPEIAGPIGIAQITGETARVGFLPLLQLVGLLSLNLGILNLLPIPALDGGRLPFLLLEAVRGGRRLSPRRESLIHLVGFAILVTFLLFVTIGIDIPRLLSGEAVLP